MKKLLSYIFISLLLVGTFVAGVPLAKATSCTPGNGFSFCRSLTVVHTKVSTNDQPSFAFEVCANSTPATGSCATVSGLNQTGAGAHVQNSNGYDINFFTDSTCTTKVTAWEMEKYVASTGEMIAWVNDGTLSHTVDTVLYMCYGNSSISAFQSTASSVWDSNYLFVGHQLNSSFPNDSTISACNGVTSASSTAGQIDGAGDFTGSSINDLLGGTTCGSTGGGSNGTLDIATSTFYTWINPNQSNDEDIYSGGASGMPQFRRDASNVISMNKYNTGSLATSSGTVPNNTWTQVAVTYDAVGNYVFYINGAASGSGSFVNPFTLLNFRFTNHTWRFGFGNGQPHMLIDEGQISNSIRGADWIATEYNNQSDPSSFETFGSENGGGSSSVNLLFFMFI